MRKVGETETVQDLAYERERHEKRGGEGLRFDFTWILIVTWFYDLPFLIKDRPVLKDVMAVLMGTGEPLKSLRMLRIDDNACRSPFPEIGTVEMVHRLEHEPDACTTYHAEDVNRAVSRESQPSMLSRSR
jgi:hypothetical protein